MLSNTEFEYFCDDWGFYIDIEKNIPVETNSKNKKFINCFQTIHEDNEYYTNVESINIQPINIKTDTKTHNTSFLKKMRSTFITVLITYFILFIL